MSRVSHYEKPEPEKWVDCLSCGQEFFIDSYELNPECPICGSKEYEENDSREWGRGYFVD